MKRLIVNADDFGYSRDVNDGIVEAHRRGIVTATTLMASGSEFYHAVLLAKDHAATLDIGVHLTLIGERALSRPGKALPESPRALVAAVLLGTLNIARELEAQITRVLEAGLQPTHLDTHKHTHVLPQVAEVVGQLSERFGIPWVRRPLAKPILGAMSLARLRRHGCRMTDHFLGYELTGRFGAVELERVIRSLPEGLSEFMCHPGRLGEELLQAHTRLKESRQRELEALTSESVRTAVQAAGVQLISYRNA
jgi:chitin disaccharide deacetylase